jgi:uncharacterized protein (DUF885 family)
MKAANIVKVLFLFTTAVFAQEDIKLKVDALTKNSNRLAEKERFGLLAKTYMDYQLQTFPEFGTFIGKPTDNTRWTDQSLAAIGQRKKDRSLFLQAFKSIKRSNLDAADQLNFDLLREAIELEKAGEKFPGELMPIDQMGGYHQQIMQVATATRIKSKKDADDFLSRLQNIPALVEQLIVLMKEGIKQGITPPKITLKGVPEQIQNIIGNDAARSPLLTNLNAYLSTLDKATEEEVSKRAAEIISQKVNPSLVKLKQYLEKTYIPTARESIALKILPDGADWYNYNIKVQTTTPLTYQQIHEIGVSEVKRIRHSMDSLMKATGFSGTFEQFMDFLRTDAKFYYDDSTALLDGYRVIAKKIDLQLPRFFGKLPRLPYGVLPVPAYDEKFQTTAYYLPGSVEVGRPGVFYANTYALESRPKWEMEALTIHEAVPGHHLQIALAAELEDVPEFRKYSFYTAFVEGWGLYSESLGSEMGLYEDPYSKFGQLTYEMWRAIRLVVDTGIHGLGWSRQQAIDYFKANAAKTEHDIAVEVDRYIGWPGQALAYKLGELKIKELRAYAEAKLGDRFDIRKFHDAVLENGALPLNILEQKIHTWVDSLK